MINFVENRKPIKSTDVKGVGGIYKIVNKRNGKFYLGRSSNLYGRIAAHIYRLKKGIEQHKDSPLGRAWKKYGESSFYVEIIERCSKDQDIASIEQKYLDELQPWKPSIGYNQDKKSSGFTSETAKAVMVTQKENGRSWCNENNPRAKLSTEIAILIRQEYHEGASSVELSKKYNVCLQSIIEVLKGTRWVQGEDIMRNKKQSESNRKSIAELYKTGNYTYIQLAELFGCSKYSVGRAVRAYSN